MPLSNIAIVPNLQKPKVRYGLSFVLGALMLFAYAPFEQGWLAALLLASWLLLLVRCQTPKQAALTGFIFGLGWFGTGISWVFVSVDRFGGLPLPATLAIMLALFAYLALYPALAGWLWLKLRKKTNRYALFTFPFIWLVTEFLRGWVMTGFPWLNLGYTQTATQFGALAPHIGETGISFVVLLAAISFAYVALTKRLEWFAVPVLLYAVAMLSPQLNPMEFVGTSSRVALIQGNIQQELKWDSEQQEPNFLTYKNLSEPLYEDFDLIIWPESAITFIEPLAQSTLGQFAQRLNATEAVVLSGIIDYNPDTKQFFNTIAVFGDQQTPYEWQNPNRYRKNKLLPIGEFVPFESILRPLAPLFNLPMSSFSRGEPTQQNLTANGREIAANICYEVVYSHYIKDQVTAGTDILLTVSNDSWFGNSHGPHQHLEIARMRAMEFGRPMLRSTNNGITAIIDHQGYIMQRIAQFEVAVATANVPHVTGTTWYTRYGSTPTWCMAIILLGVSLLRRNRAQA
ncbi:apolipoprotein N-acyltransferase [Aliidiomarina quisquiliarum]|uniref:apolipoprotein N-acyltransferase n=1 Tax=Aliidiomarina quisquiliarum TaxID=2938947 RepID=UPI00208E3ADD|nr:apolipoprotein N-acyltransferase [Aliidiomarina quisquiliarum]MCO4321799.1 apolipoprotein N-acyltransferase [Aliidiomarina quisquiliarum]